MSNKTHDDVDVANDDYDDEDEAVAYKTSIYCKTQIKNTSNSM